MNYTVKAGDTLSKIAAANGTTVSALVAANRIADPNKIAAGQVLTIPGKPGSVLLDANGAVVAQPTKGSTVADWIKAGATAYIDIKNADANRKLAIAQGIPISTTPAEQVVDVHTPNESASSVAKYGLIALTALVAGALWLGPSSSSPRT